MEIDYEHLWIDIDNAYKQYVYPVSRLLNVKLPDLMIIADRENSEKIKFACAKAKISPDSNGIIRNIKPMHVELYLSDIIRGFVEWNVNLTNELIVMHSVVDLIHEIYHIYQYTYQKKIFIGSKLLDGSGFEPFITEKIERECELFTRKYIHDNIIKNELIRRINDMEEWLSKAPQFYGKVETFFKELRRQIKLINLLTEDKNVRVIMSIDKENK